MINFFEINFQKHTRLTQNLEEDPTHARESARDIAREGFNNKIVGSLLEGGVDHEGCGYGLSNRERHLQGGSKLKKQTCTEGKESGSMLIR